VAYDKVKYAEYYRRPEVRARYNREKKELRQTLMMALGTVCQKCGFKDSRALQFDHVHGNGRKTQRDKGLWKNRLRFYKYLIKNPEYTVNEIQLLCANCNWIKRYENNEVQRT